MARAKSFEDMDLVGMAVHGRAVLGLIVGYVVLIAGNILIYILWPTTSAVPVSLGVVFWVLWLGLLVASMVMGALLMHAMGVGIASIVMWTILMMLFSFLVLIALYSQSSTTLKVLGVRSGFFGVSAANRERLKPGRCRQCGYDRSGLDDILAACPECNRVPIVW